VNEDNTTFFGTDTSSFIFSFEEWKEKLNQSLVFLKKVNYFERDL